MEGFRKEVFRRWRKEIPPCPSLSKGINAVARKCLDRDRWITIEIRNLGKRFLKDQIGVVPMIVLEKPDDTYQMVRLPESIAHVCFTFPLHEGVVPLDERLDLTILLQEQDFAAFVRQIRILNLVTNYNVPEGTGHWWYGGAMYRGRDGLRVTANFDTNVRVDRIRSMMSCLKMFKGRLNEVSISGSSIPVEARAIEKSILVRPTSVAEFTYWEILCHRSWLKHQLDLCMKRKEPMSAVNISEMYCDAIRNWLNLDETPESGHSHPLYASQQVSQFQKLCQATHGLNIALLNIEHSETMPLTQHFDLVWIGQPSFDEDAIDVVVEEAGPLLKAYTRVVIGIWQLVQGKWQTESQRELPFPQDLTPIELGGPTPLTAHWVRDAAGKLVEAWELAKQTDCPADQFALYESCHTFAQHILEINGAVVSNDVLEAIHEFWDIIKGKIKPVKFIVGKNAFPKELHDKEIFDILPKYEKCAPGNDEWSLFDGPWNLWLENSDGRVDHSEGFWPM
ncbi:hypothetical protein CC80DRAFT_542805 [Byssothecium circinans]|uniref:Uncharacterized protein n=1 Tax=Byssothecium circinans TaxID=147558 RepID=A0A6A5UDV2_9PLEO|nr:hypothetical protein CC80DRAFT_542805 [Byssothecium circinans]